MKAERRKAASPTGDQEGETVIIRKPEGGPRIASVAAVMPF